MNPDPILPFDTEARLRRALAEAAASDGLRTPDRVEATLRSAVRSRNRARLAARLALSGSLAAAVLFGLFLLRQPAPAPAPRAQVAVARPPQPPAPAPQPVKQVPAKPAAAPRAPLPPASVPQSPFLPVGHWQAVEPIERGTIVRVRLPNSSLAGFGFPVNPDRWNESIPADVVLAEDGTLRAVRFVTPVQ
jgi:hypothetical protein